MEDKMTRKLSLLLLVLVLLNFIQMCGNQGDDPAAIVSGRVITLSEFKEKFARGKALNVLKAATDSMKLSELDKMIDRQLLIVDGYQLGLDKDSLLMKRINQTYKDRVARKVWETDVIGTIISEAEVRELYEKQQKEVKVLDLVLRFDKNDSVDTEADVKEMIDRLHSYLEDGAKFDSIARRYSQDRFTAAKGGNKGFLRWNANVASNEVYRQAFQMEEGALSKPFKNKKEYHIIKVEKINQKPVEKFEVERSRITNQLMSKRRPKIEKQKNKVMEDLIAKVSGRFVDENIKLMVEKITKRDPVADSIRRAKHLRPDMFVNLADEDTSKALYSFAGDHRISIGHVIRILKTVDPARRPQIRSESELKQLVERMLLFELFAYEGKSRGYMNAESVVKEITQIREDAMLKMVKHREIEEKVNAKDEDISEYYALYKEKYIHPERRNIQEIWITDKARADAALKALKSGRSFTAVADQFNERVATKKKSGNLGLIRKEQYGNIGKEAFKMKKGEVSGIINMGRNFSIVTVHDIILSQQKTFEEVKFQLRNEVKRDQRLQLERDLLKRLRDEIDIVIFEEKVKALFKGEIS